jgi:hypothetical protein
VQVKNGALKPLKQRKSPRHLQRRAERQRPESRDERRTRKMQRQADYIASKARVEEAMKPEKERQARKKLFERLRWLSRFPAYEDVVQIEGDKLMKTWDNQRGDIDPPEEIYIEQEMVPVLNSERALDAIFKTSNTNHDESGFEGLVTNELPPN